MDPTIGGWHVEREVQEGIPQVGIVVDQGDEERCDGAALHGFNIDVENKIVRFPGRLGDESIGASKMWEKILRLVPEIEP